MIAFAEHYSGIFGLIAEYGDINEQFNLIATNKLIFRIFFQSYISKILDIDKIIHLLQNKCMINNYKKTNIWNSIDNHKRNIFIIETHIKFLWKKIKIPFTNNTEILPILNTYSNDYKVRIPLLISNPYILDLIAKLLSKDYTISQITKNLYKLFPLYKKDNIQLINKIINKNELLNNIKNFTIPLLSLYTINNKPLIDKLLIKYDIREIVFHFDELLSLYTGRYIKTIDHLITVEYELYTVIRRVNYYKKY